MDLTAQDLTLPLIAAEPNGCLSSETIDRAATLLTTAVKAQVALLLRCALFHVQDSEPTSRTCIVICQGVVALSPQAHEHGTATVVSKNLLEDCRIAALQACDRLEAVLHAKRSRERSSNADCSSLQHGEAPFRYREICWRGEGRYDVMCDLSTAPWSEPSLKELPVLAPRS